MTTRVLRTATIVASWGLCLYGALAIARWEGPLDHALCGPWGCGPRLPPLLACHAAWAVALTLPAGFVAWSKLVTPAACRWIGLSLMAVAAAIMAALFASHVLVWWPQAEPGQRPYFWHHLAFDVVTMVDVPVAQLFVVGLGLVGVSRWRDRPRQPRPAVHSPQ